MNVTRGQIIARGLSNRCPNCGELTLFPPKSLRINRRCSHCGVDIDRGEGFFLGPWVINYTIVVFGVVLPVIALGSAAVVPWRVAWGIAAIGCFLVPALLYRSSWSWWLMIYFFFLPQRLPANGGPMGAEAED